MKLLIQFLITMFLAVISVFITEMTLNSLGLSDRLISNINIAIIILISFYVDYCFKK